jgi:hypothetical protein
MFAQGQADNIVFHLPGPIDNARNVKNELEAFNLFFDENVIRIIVGGTNIYIGKIKHNFSWERVARETDTTEN